MRHMKNKFVLALLICALLSLLEAGCAGRVSKGSYFPDFEGVDYQGNPVTNQIFQDYDATIINIWHVSTSNCTEQMEQLEAYYQRFKEQNINLIGIDIDSPVSDDLHDLSLDIISRKGVTFTNVIPDAEGKFFTDFISNVDAYPVAYIVDRQGKIIGKPIWGALEQSEDQLLEYLDQASGIRQMP